MVRYVIHISDYILHSAYLLIVVFSPPEVHAGIEMNERKRRTRSAKGRGVGVVFLVILFKEQGKRKRK